MKKNKTILIDAEFKSVLIRVLICTYIIGLLIHGFIFTNMVCANDAMAIDYRIDYEFMRAIGRWGQPLYMVFRGTLTIPWIAGMLELLWIALSAFLICVLFGFKDNLRIILTCGVLVSCISVAYTNVTSLMVSDMFMFSLFLSILSFFLIDLLFMRRDEEDKTIFIDANRVMYVALVLLAIACLTLSFGIYQAYICVPILLSVLLSVIRLYQNDLDIIDIVKEVLLFAGVCVVSLILYLLLAKVVINHYDLTLLDNYNSLSRLNDYSDVDYFSLIKKGYLFVIDKLIVNPVAFSSRSLLANRIAVGMLGIGAIAIIVKTIYKRQISKIRVAFMLVLVLISPLLANLIYLITKGMVHDLMTYAFCLYFLFVLALIPKVSTKFVKGILCACISIVIWINCIYTNQLYTRRILIVESSYQILNRLTYQIEHVNGYIPGETKVAIIGALDNSTLLIDREGFDWVKGTGFWHNAAVSGNHWMSVYWNVYMGYNISLLSEEEVAKYETNELVQSMGVFPSNDSCKMIGDVLVVKLSEND